MNKKTLILICLAICLILIGCIKDYPEPPIFRQTNSPLPQMDIFPQPDSPLAIGIGPEPEAVPVQPVPRGLIGPNPIWFPFIFSQTNTRCKMDPLADRLLELLIKDPEQKRSGVYCDRTLVQVAQHRAQDMQNRRYFDHKDPEGHYPNFWALQFGCKLPPYYPPNGNSIESIALNYPTVEAAWLALKISPGHRMHILGEHDFYKEQKAAGVAVSIGQYGLIYVILTAKNC